MTGTNAVPNLSLRYLRVSQYSRQKSAIDMERIDYGFMNDNFKIIHFKNLSK